MLRWFYESNYRNMSKNHCNESLKLNLECLDLLNKSLSTNVDNFCVFPRQKIYMLVGALFESII